MAFAAWAALSLPCQFDGPGGRMTCIFFALPLGTPPLTWPVICTGQMVLAILREKENMSWWQLSISSKEDRIKFIILSRHQNPGHVIVIFNNL